MEMWGLLAERQVLQQFTPATQNTILVEHRQGHAIQMEHGQGKNQPVRVSFMNGAGREEPNWINSLEESGESKYEEEGIYQTFVILYTTKNIFQMMDYIVRVITEEVGRMITCHLNYRALMSIPQSISTKIYIKRRC